MKLIVRADDYGFTPVYNDGQLKAVREGIVTTVDYMLDTPGMEDGAEKLKQYPWVSVGWHTHFWWKPVLPADKVSTLIDPATGKFRKDMKSASDVDFDQAKAECRAEVERCIRLLGRAPDTTDLDWEHTGIFEAARREICDEYGIIYGFATKYMKSAHVVSNANEVLKDVGVSHPLPKYAGLDIYFPSDVNSLLAVHQDSAAKFLAEYDPVQYYIDDPDNMKDHLVAVMPWHPGYMDDFMRLCYDNPLLNACRPVDLYALTSDRIKAWVRDNKVELVNYRDAIYGTREYQNHLKATGSDMAI